MSFFENANTFYNFNLDGKCSIKIQKYKNRILVNIIYQVDFKEKEFAKNVLFKIIKE